MEKALIRISPENLVTIFILSAVAYLGVIGAQKGVAFLRARTGM
jgi:hypothetical protein